jgi:hypothetical protein
VDETATGSATFFGPVGSVVVHFNRPSIDPGVIALVWALALGTFIYFGLIAVGSSGAFAIVIASVSAAGIWLLVQTRGDSA